MLTPNWIDVGSLIGASIIAICSIFGAIMGFRNHQKINKIKSLDLRLKLKMDIEDVKFNVDELRTLMSRADGSRSRVCLVSNRFRRSSLEDWKKELNDDYETINQVLVNIDNERIDFDRLTHKKLEKKLVEVHKLQNRISYISEKYRKELDWDDEER